MKTIKAILHKGEWLLDALKRVGYEMIPTGTILNKTLTGLGATHSEIHSKRNSIIIEPNVPVILGKLNDNDNMEAVYEKCAPYSIKISISGGKSHSRYMISFNLSRKPLFPLRL